MMNTPKAIFFGSMQATLLGLRREIWGFIPQNVGANLRPGNQPDFSEAD